MEARTLEIMRFVRGSRETFQLSGWECICGQRIIDLKEFEDMERQVEIMETFAIPVGSRWQHKAGWFPARQVVGFSGDFVYSVNVGQIAKMSIRRFLAQWYREEK